MTFRYDKDEEKLIVSSATRIEYHQMKLWLTRHVKGYKFMPAFKMGIWDGQQSYFDNGKVQMGLWRECLKGCKEINVPFMIENKEDFPLNREITLESVIDFCKDFFKNHKVKNKDGNWVNFMPYDYQIETAYKILKNRYCMAEVATSGGKSLVISIVIFYTLKNIEPNAKFLIIVPSITLVTQFYENILEYNFGVNYLNEWEEKVDFKEGDISQIKSTNPNYDPCSIRMEEIMSDKPRKYTGPNQPNIYIGCFQSLEKWPKEFFKKFHTVAVDEAHQAKAQTITKILKRTFKSAYNRFGVSGTFPSDESLEILTIQSVLGPNVTKIEAKKLIESGTITPMSIKALILNHNNKEALDQIKYIRKMGAGADALRIEKDIIHRSEKRVNFIQKLVEKCNSNTLLLFHTIEYGTKLYETLKENIKDKEFYYIDGEINNKKREIIKKEMDVNREKKKIIIFTFPDGSEIELDPETDIKLQNGEVKKAYQIEKEDLIKAKNENKSRISNKKIIEKEIGKVRVLVASYGTLSTGVSINSIFNVILADSFKSEQIIIQSIGRALRKHHDKKVANIFDIVDVFNDRFHDNILYNHFKEREKFYLKREYPYKVIKINLNQS